MIFFNIKDEKGEWKHIYHKSIKKNIVEILIIFQSASGKY